MILKICKNRWLFDNHSTEEVIHKHFFSSVSVEVNLSWLVMVAATYVLCDTTYGTALYNPCNLNPQTPLHQNGIVVPDSFKWLE